MTHLAKVVPELCKEKRRIGIDEGRIASAREARRRIMGTGRWQDDPPPFVVID
jgi:hypothetical protein